MDNSLSVRADKELSTTTALGFGASEALWLLASIAAVHSSDEAAKLVDQFGALRG